MIILYSAMQCDEFIYFRVSTTLPIFTLIIADKNNCDINYCECGVNVCDFELTGHIEDSHFVCNQL